MSKRRGGSLPRVMPKGRPSGLDIRMIVPGLPIVAPDPLPRTAACPGGNPRSVAGRATIAKSTPTAP